MMRRSESAHLLLLVVLIVAGFGVLYAQDVKKASVPDSVTIKAEDAKGFKESAQNAERTQLQVRALTAEIQLATKNLEELRGKAEREQKDLQQVLIGLAGKAGISQDRLTEYELSEKDGGLLLTKRVAKKE